LISDRKVVGFTFLLVVSLHQHLLPLEESIKFQEWLIVLVVTEGQDDSSV